MQQISATLLRSSIACLFFVCLLSFNLCCHDYYYCCCVIISVFLSSLLSEPWFSLGPVCGRLRIDDGQRTNAYSTWRGWMGRCWNKPRLWYFYFFFAEFQYLTKFVYFLILANATQKVVQLLWIYSFFQWDVLLRRSSNCFALDIIAAYCPCHNVRSVPYPPILIKTSVNDPIVSYQQVCFALCLSSSLMHLLGYLNEIGLLKTIHFVNKNYNFLGPKVRSIGSAARLK